MLKVLQKALNGWHGYGVENGNRVSVSFYTNNLQHCLPRASEGTMVIDKSDIPVDRLTTLVVKGPMFDPTLAPDEVDRFGDKETLADIMLPGLQGGYFAAGVLSLVEKSEGDRLGSLDGVGLDIWVALWREAGARIGMVQNGEVVWETQLK